MKKQFYPFLLLLSAVGMKTFAQSPGGVSTNLTLWIKSNSGISSSGGLIDSWTYSNDGTKSFTSTLTTRPSLTSSSINFNSAATFSGAQWMNGPTGVNAPITAGNDAYSVFCIWRSTAVTNGTQQRVWSQYANGGANDGVSMWLYTDGSGVSRYGNQPEIGPTFVHAAPVVHTTGAWYISQLNLLNQATNDQEIIDQSNLSSPIVLNTDPNGVNGAGVRTLADFANRLGARNSATEEALRGDIAEVIVFNSSISGAERNRIFSYLALKYGIHIGTDMINASGTTIWSAAAAGGAYNNAVFGIGQDNGSGLTVNQSNSILTGSGNGTGQSGAGNIVISNPSALASGDYLLVGHNNAALTETASNLPALISTGRRFERQWRVQHTGATGTVDLSFDFTGLTSATTGVEGTPGDFRLIVDEDGNGNFQDGTIRYYTISGFTGDVAAIPNVTLNDGEVFTIVTKYETALPVDWVSFTSRVSGQNDVVLNWQVESNESAHRYEVEHSTNGSSFTKVAEVLNEISSKHYSYTFKNAPAGKNYFRIYQVDFDGKSVYSKTLPVTLNGNGDYSMRVFSNPVQSGAALFELTLKRSGNAVIEIYSNTGSRVYSKQQALPTGSTKLNVGMENLPRGSYILQVRIGETVFTERLVKM